MTTDFASIIASQICSQISAQLGAQFGTNHTAQLLSNGAPSNGDPAPGTYVVVRGRDCGVHAGEFVAHPAESTVVLANSRRVWYWKGAASLSELAVYGAASPAECKFGVCIPTDTVLVGVCEIIVCQPAGKQMIVSCPNWCV